ncbi:hypothetical protein FQR65_LT03328 [Abscondita terminalis]|nr:hypothetical protein FQR65_LT03328 [Abscondita terminalis]
MKIISALVLVIVTAQLVLSNKPNLTVKKVPLYIRQSWLALFEPHLSECICESKVNPILAFKSIINTEVSSNPCLKCFYKCLYFKLNIMDATNGEFIENEMYRQIDGLTTDIFKKCDIETKNEADLCKKSFDMYMCVVHALSKPEWKPSTITSTTTAPSTLTTTTKKPTTKPTTPVHTIS